MTMCGHVTAIIQEIAQRVPDPLSKKVGSGNIHYYCMCMDPLSHSACSHSGATLVSSLPR